MAEKKKKKSVTQMTQMTQFPKNPHAYRVRLYGTHEKFINNPSNPSLTGMPSTTDASIFHRGKGDTGIGRRGCPFSM